MLDLAIIGGGAAGLTAAIYAARAGLQFAVLEQDGWGGGQIVSAHQVENYPGLGSVSGEALGEAFRSQAEGLGADIRFAPVTALADRGAYKEIQVEGEEPVQARAVIAATGASPRKLGVLGEQAFTGRGVSYCAVCDGAFYAGKDVLVVGGGDTAVEDAIYLSSLCRSVKIALRRAQFRGAKRRAELLERLPNVEILRQTNLKAILGENSVELVRLEQQGAETELPIDGVFLAVGVEPDAGYLAGLPLTWEGGYVVAGETGETEVPGLFVAGDLRRKQLRQVVTSAADGANAASSAAAWLESHRAPEP